MCMLITKIIKTFATKNWLSGSAPDTHTNQTGNTNLFPLDQEITKIVQQHRIQNLNLKDDYDCYR